MMFVEIDAANGLLVCRATAASKHDAASLATLVDGERRLARCPEIPGRPKVRLILTDPGTPPAGPKEREQLSKLVADRNVPRLVAFVSPAVITRAAFGVISVLRGATFAPQERAFATKELAIDWLEERRPGVREPLLALVQRVDDTLRRQSPLGSLRGTLTGSTALRS